MRSFALITEGITDQISLETILCAYYPDQDLDIRPIQPIRDATDESRQQGFSNWELVLEFCALPEFAYTCQFNDYVIVQIDTDCGEHQNFGVALTDGGRDRSVATIIAEVIALLGHKIGPAVCAQYREQIIFAVAVHSIECWFLPLYETLPAKQSRSKNCGEHLARAADRQSIPYRKDYAGYKLLSKAFEPKGALAQCAALNASFKIFIDSLPKTPGQP